MKDSTTYLHSKNNKEVQAQYFKETTSADCLYSRNLVAVMESQEVSDFYGQHLLKCQVCQQKALNWKKKMDELKNLIPVYSIPDSQRPRFERGLVKLDKMFKRKSRKEFKFQLRKIALTTKNFSLDFLSIFISRQFLIGLIWSLIAFAICTIIF